MLYHYTDRLSAAEIKREAVIRAMPMTLHRDMLGQDAGFRTEAVVWLTINPILDGTVIAKMIAGGWPRELTGDLYRFSLPDDYPCLSLGEYVDATGMDPDWWQWSVRTGQMAGSDYTTWRLCRAYIPAADWLAVEVLESIAGRTNWKKG